MSSPVRPVPRGACLGVGLGVSGWALGVLLLCALAGEPRLFLTLGLPSLGLALVAAATLIALWKRTPRPSTRHIAGSIFLLFALLGGVVQFWVMPTLLQSARAREALRATGSVTTLPWPLLAASALAGIACLAWPTRPVTPP